MKIMMIAVCDEGEDFTPFSVETKTQKLEFTDECTRYVVEIDDVSAANKNEPPKA